MTDHNTRARQEWIRQLQAEGYTLPQPDLFVSCTQNSVERWTKQRVTRYGRKRWLSGFFIGIVFGLLYVTFLGQFLAACE